MTAVTVEEYSILLAQDLYDLMPNLRLTATQRDVWDTIVAHIDEGYRAPVSRSEIAGRLNIEAQRVTRATTRLAKAGLIFRRENDTSSWYVNPQLAYKGSDTEWVQVLADLPEDTPPLDAPTYRVRPPRRTTHKRRPDLRLV